ncbi:hypothetical protein VTK26DRAFT_3969 [Humicola hyalothermophila]
MASSSAPITATRIPVGVLRTKCVYPGRVRPDDGSIISFRCNGRDFEIEVSSSLFSASPAITAHYRRFLSAVRSRFEPAPGDIDDNEDQELVEDEFYDWLIGIFEPVFLDVAPDVPPSFDPDKIRRGEAKPLLSEYLFPETHRCRLEAVNERAIPIHIPNEESHFGDPLEEIDPSLVDELKRYVKFFDPVAIDVSFTRPEQALYDDTPSRVLVDLTGSGQKTTCFFQACDGFSDTPPSEELEGHLRLLKAGNLAPKARVQRLLGIYGAVMLGYGLKYAPIPLRQRWAAQVRETLQQLHEAGVLWGEVKPGHVLINKNDDAWLIGFGGNKLKGWGWATVDREEVGTEKRGLEGAERIVEFLFSEDYEPAQ